MPVLATVQYSTWQLGTKNYRNAVQAEAFQCLFLFNQMLLKIDFSVTHLA
jgi:hypothetical protein